MSENYNDIINKSHHVSQSRPHLPQSSRAAQFASFAALTGYEDAIDETARLTDEKYELCEEKAAELNKKIRFISEHITEEPYCKVIYFVADKTGKTYFTKNASEHASIIAKLKKEGKWYEY